MSARLDQAEAEGGMSYDDIEWVVCALATIAAVVIVSLVIGEMVVGK